MCVGRTLRERSPLQTPTGMEWCVGRTLLAYQVYLQQVNFGGGIFDIFIRDILSLKSSVEPQYRGKAKIVTHF